MRRLSDAVSLCATLHPLFETACCRSSVHTEFTYQGELWAAVVAAVCAGLAGAALALYLRRALHSASAVVAVAIVLAYSAPLLARSNYLADDWTWLPGSAGVVGVVLLPFVVWAWSSRQGLSADE